MRTHLPVVRPSLLVAAAGSTLITAVGVLWLVAPERYPFGPGDEFGVDASLLAATDADLAAVLAIGTGAIGLLTAACLATHPRRTAAYALGAAAAQAVVLGLLVPDQQVLVVVTYVLAFLVPPVLLGAKIVDGLRHPRTRWWLVTAMAGVITLGIAGGVLRPDTLLDLAVQVGGGLANAGARPLYLLLALGVAICWAVVVVRDTRASSPGGLVLVCRAWIDRWGVRATWVAVLCPMPYVLSRLTWFTPWPLFPDGADDDPALRLTGILLGLVAECCAWLTLSLIRPRGEVFPPWVPFVGGRDVPVMAAVIPGLTGGLLLTIAGRSMIQQTLFDPALGPVMRWLDLFLMPLWLWGPALAIATLAYWQRRSPRGSVSTLRSCLSASPCYSGPPCSRCRPGYSSTTGPASSDSPRP